MMKSPIATTGHLCALLFCFATNPALNADLSNTFFFSHGGTATMLPGVNGSVTEGDFLRFNNNSDTSTLVFDDSNFGDGFQIDALHSLNKNNFVFSIGTDEVIGGISFQSGDLIHYNASTQTVSEFLDSSAIPGVNINALFVGSNGNIIFSTATNSQFGNEFFEDGDLIELNTATNIFSNFLDEDETFGTNVDINAVHILDDGRFVFSFVGSETIDGTTFADGDLVLYDADAPGSAFTLFVAESEFGSNNLPSQYSTDAVTFATIPEPTCSALLIASVVLMASRRRI